MRMMLGLAGGCWAGVGSVTRTSARRGRRRVMLIESTGVNIEHPTSNIEHRTLNIEMGGFGAGGEAVGGRMRRPRHAWRLSMMMDDYYLLLGIGRDSGMTQIKRAYRLLSLR